MAAELKKFDGADFLSVPDVSIAPFTELTDMKLQQRVRRVWGDLNFAEADNFKAPDQLIHYCVGVHEECLGKVHGVVAEGLDILAANMVRYWHVSKVINEASKGSTMGPDIKKGIMEGYHITEHEFYGLRDMNLKLTELQAYELGRHGGSLKHAQLLALVPDDAVRINILNSFCQANSNPSLPSCRVKAMRVLQDAMACAMVPTTSSLLESGEEEKKATVITIPQNLLDAQRAVAKLDRGVSQLSEATCLTASESLAGMGAPDMSSELIRNFVTGLADQAKEVSIKLEKMLEAAETTLVELQSVAAQGGSAVDVDADDEY